MTTFNSADSAYTYREAGGDHEIKYEHALRRTYYHAIRTASSDKALLETGLHIEDAADQNRQEHLSQKNCLFLLRVVNRKAQELLNKTQLSNPEYKKLPGFDRLEKMADALQAKLFPEKTSGPKEA